MPLPIPPDVAKIEETAESLRIEIPARSSVLPMPGLILVTLGGGAAVVALVMAAFRSFGPMGGALTLMGLTVLCVLVTRPFLRGRRFRRDGTEVLTVDRTTFTLRHRVGEEERSWAYPLDTLSELRLEHPDAELDTGENRPPLHGLPPGLLAMNEARRPLRFGMGLDRAEARRVLMRLRAFLEEIGRGGLNASLPAAPTLPPPEASPPASLEAGPLETRAARPGAARLGCSFFLAYLLMMGWIGARVWMAWIETDQAGEAPLWILSMLPGWMIFFAFFFPMAFVGYGRERFSIVDGSLVVERGLFGLRRRFAFRLDAIRAPRVRLGASDLRAHQRRIARWTWPLITPLEAMRRHRLLFDYGAATIDCGAFLDESGATELVHRLIATGVAAGTPDESPRVESSGLEVEAVAESP